MRASLAAAAAAAAALVVSWGRITSLMTMEMVRCVWQLVYVIVTSVAAAEADVGQVMILEDEPLSPLLAGKPVIPGEL